MLMVVDGGVLLLAFDVLILVGNDIFTSGILCSQFCFGTFGLLIIEVADVRMYLDSFSRRRENAPS